MSWQAESGYRYRMPEGYALHPGPGGEVAFGPPRSTTSVVLEGIELGEETPAPTEELRASMAADLAAWHVRTVVVGPMPHEDRAVATLSRVVGRPPERVGGVWVWWDVSSP
jgi:dolichyl-phosphate beta-glucosyltransferase